ncbi:MAG: helix-turn-helix domain-containing protein [bacterium]|nr:helix-turn-helix domain-containing protein [bacterium]
MEIKSYIENLGLTEKEAAVYLALLQLGQAPVQTISRKADIVRPTAYVVLDSLIHKGLCKKGLIGKKTVFIASPPEDLDNLIRKRERDAHEQRVRLHHLLPELRALYALSEERPSIRLFEGKEGLKNLQREFVEISSEPMYGMGSDDVMENLFPRASNEYDEEIRGVRVKAGIKSFNIYTTSDGEKRSPESDKKALRESRYIEKEKLPIKAHFSVHGPLLSIVSFRKKIIGVLIEHVDIADSFKAIFDVAWKQLGDNKEKTDKAT